MKKLIFTLLLLVTVNLSTTAIVVPYTHINYSHRHSRKTTEVDNSLQTSLTRKDYHFRCEKCGNNFVIHDMLYHENTDMYFYYKDTGYLLKVLQPYEGRKFCDKCNDKRFLIIVVFFLIIVFICGSIIYFFDKD